MLRVLFVEDRDDDVRLVMRELKKGGFDPAFLRVETADDMRAALAQHEWDLIISDFSMPKFSGPAALEVLKETGLDLPFIIVSGTIGEEAAVAALKAGAHDFLSKRNLPRLVPAVERELREAESRRERRRAEERLRELEEQFRHAQKMEEVGRLAGGIAHDFNNVLTAIQGYASLTLADMPKDHEHYQDVQEILDAAEWAASFTRQLLAFSRKQVTQPEVVETNQMVSNMRRLLSRVIGDHYSLELDLHASVGPIVADRGHMEQVIMNLVTNARDAMPAGGRILVCTRRQQTKPAAPMYGDDAAGAGPYTVIRVIDQGHGIAPETVDRIFEPFYTTKEAGKGTGLGLSTAYGIVVQNGGFMTVETGVGDGSVFSVYLPEANGIAAAARPAGKEAAAVAGASRCCLVVEDESAIRRLLQRMLERAGFDVLTAADGPEAVEMLRSHPEIEVLITDLMLPSMHGTNLIATAKQLSPRIKALLTSGYSPAEVALPPTCVFLEKPFTPAELLNAIGEL